MRALYMPRLAHGQEERGGAMAEEFLGSGSGSGSWVEEKGDGGSSLLAEYDLAEASLVSVRTRGWGFPCL